MFEAARTVGSEDRVEYFGRTDKALQKLIALFGRLDENGVNVHAVSESIINICR